MEEEYKDIGTNFDRTIEECSELIKEICKLNRFGFYSYHPGDNLKTPNYEKVLEEIKDVRRTCEELEEWIITEKSIRERFI